MNHKLLLKTALALQHQFERIRRSRVEHIQLPHDPWKLLQKWSRQLIRAQARRYVASTQTCRYRLRETIQQLIYGLNQLDAELSGATVTPPVPSLRTLYEELRMLCEEFEHVELLPARNRIHEITEPIELNDIPLGRFEIEFDTSALGTQQPYRVVPLEPNYPHSGDSVPHPHVQNQTLCEGDGRSAIQMALEQGRIGDFFVLVQQILRTYNADSPYVDLESWLGIPCHDCGETIAEEESYGCDECSHRLCDHCVCICDNCEVTLCHGCVNRCAGCDQTFCSTCLCDCSNCAQEYCSDCMEHSLCETCQESKEDDAQSENTPTHTSPFTTSKT